MLRLSSKKIKLQSFFLILLLISILVWNPFNITDRLGRSLGTSLKENILYIEGDTYPNPSENLSCVNLHGARIDRTRVDLAELSRIYHPLICVYYRVIWQIFSIRVLFSIFALIFFYSSNRITLYLRQTERSLMNPQYEALLLRSVRILS